MHPDEIANLLRRAVCRRILPPGQPLNQDDLAKRFGVSRIPLREALRTLAAEGLIIIRPGAGAVVTELRPAELEELCGLRLLLEPPLASDTIRHARAVDIDQLEEMVQRMDGYLGSQERDEWSTLNYAFHRQLHELSGKRHHVRLLTQVLNLVEPYSRIYTHVVGSLSESQRELRGIVEALVARDAARLRALQEASIRTTRDRLLAEMAATTHSSDPLNMLMDLGG
jgi:DNA-binding GntR family transcriptional regulator